MKRPSRMTGWPGRGLERFAQRVTRGAGGSSAFGAQAIHLQLNELVAAVEGASNRLINLTHSHSIEEAERRHETKRRRAPSAAE